MAPYKLLFLSAVAASTMAAPSWSQSLQDQISAVNQAQNERKAAERAAAQQAAEEERSRQAAADARARAAASERRAQAERENARQAEKEKLEQAEAKADKTRDQSYEDDLRKLELEERKIALEEKKARAARTNDFIDQELKQQSAQTDVIQSQADATRDLSQGTKNLLTSEGKSKENVSQGTKNRLTSEGKAKEEESSSWLK